MRLWRWLAITAVLFGLLWTLPGLGEAQIEALTPQIFHVLAGFVLAAALIVSGFLFGPDATPGRIDATSSGALAAYLLGATLLVVASRHDPLALLAFVLLVAATLAIAWRSDAAAAAVPAAGALVTLTFAQWAINPNIGEFTYGAGQVPEPDGYLFGTHLVLGAGLAALFGPRAFSRKAAANDRFHRSCGAPRRWSRRSRCWSRYITASPNLTARSRLRALHFCWQACSPMPRRFWSGASRVPARRRPPRFWRPTRSLHLRFASPWRWRKAGSPWRWR